MNGKNRMKLAARARNINALLLTLALLLAILMSALIMKGIAKDASADLAFFYSSEAAERFESYISRDLASIQKVTRSRAVTEWFADESDWEKKASAYNEIMDCAELTRLAEL